MRATIAVAVGVEDKGLLIAVCAYALFHAPCVSYASFAEHERLFTLCLLVTEPAKLHKDNGWEHIISE